MAKTDEKPIMLDTANPSRNFLTVTVMLAVLVFFLAALSIAIALNFFDETMRVAVVALLVLIPLAGLIVATRFIYRHSQRLLFLNKDEEMFSQLMSPESQRRKLNAEVKELAALMKIPAEQMSDLRAAYILAEDLALRKIEQEMKLPLKRHIKIGGAEFDAVFISRDQLTFVEVTFLVTSNISQEKINTIFEKIVVVQKKFVRARRNSKFSLMLALVIQLDAKGEAKLRSSLTEKLAETPVDVVEIRFFDFEELQRTFTEE